MSHGVASPTGKCSTVLFVHNLCGEVLEFPLEGDAWVSKMRRCVRERWGMPIAEQRFCVGQHEVEIVGETLPEEAGIHPGGRLDMTVLRTALTAEVATLARDMDVSLRVITRLQRRGVHAKTASVLLRGFWSFDPHCDVEEALSQVRQTYGHGSCWVLRFDDGSTLCRLKGDSNGDRPALTQYWDGPAGVCQLVPFTTE
eukprot:CAMPEP_0194542244 /NCGR_PEP_ID=MMETSP0253-20130528/83688_1 /TAXON_ID=2966 /ORGANISM="Noctiluca scintillans" /LENGTH=198 /DNA_ID=CAMNT_0039388843 /DNA_START=77 /DNA_END=670 /DNA_ORIENTATION=+